MTYPRSEMAWTTLDSITWNENRANPETEYGVNESSPKDLILTRRIRSYLKKAYTFGAFAGGHPFKWNKTLQRVELASSKKQLLWKVNMVLAFAHATFVFARCVQISLDKSSSKSHGIYMRFMAAFFMLAVVLHVGIIQNRNDIPAFTNCYLDFMDEVERKFITNRGKKPLLIRVIGIVMEYVYFCINTMCVLMTVISLLRPSSEEQLSSLLPNSEQLSMKARIPFALFLAYIEYIYHSSAFAVIQTSMACCSSTMVILSEMCPKTCQITRAELRTQRVLLEMYQLLRMRMNWFNHIFATSVIPSAKALMMLWCIFCAYGSLKMHGVQSLALGFLGLFSFIFLVTIFSVLAEIQRRSVYTRLFWICLPQKNRWFTKSLKAMPDIHCTLGGMYYVDRKMVVTMMHCIINETVTFVLLNR